MHPARLFRVSPVIVWNDRSVMDIYSLLQCRVLFEVPRRRPGLHADKLATLRTFYLGWLNDNAGLHETVCAEWQQSARQRVFHHEFLVLKGTRTLGVNYELLTAYNTMQDQHFNFFDNLTIVCYPFRSVSPDLIWTTRFQLVDELEEV